MFYKTCFTLLDSFDHPVKHRPTLFYKTMLDDILRCFTRFDGALKCNDQSNYGKVGFCLHCFSFRIGWVTLQQNLHFFHHFWWFVVWLKNKRGRVNKCGRVSPKTWWVFILTWSVLCILQIMSVDWMKFWLKRFKSSLNWEVRFFLLILDFVI